LTSCRFSPYNTPTFAVADDSHSGRRIGELACRDFARNAPLSFSLRFWAPSHDAAAAEALMTAGIMTMGGQTTICTHFAWVVRGFSTFGILLDVEGSS
jgi:hypothetical protein